MINYRLLCYSNPYLKEWDTHIIKCTPYKYGDRDAYALILDKSAFYPEGGGQPGDRGSLSIFGEFGETEIPEQSISVIDALYIDDEAAIICDRELPSGTKVHARLDWDRRFRFMQEHSGEHIVSGLIHKHYGFNNTGFHMSDVISIDFDGYMDWNELMKIEELANSVIYENMPLVESFPSESELKNLEYRSKKELSGDVRIISIEDTDSCACCGTHVASTGEIGLIKFLSLIHYKGGMRAELVCGSNAMSYIRRMHSQNTAISRLLSAKPYELEAAVERLKEELIAKNQLTGKLRAELFTLKAASYAKNEKLLSVFEDGLSANELRKLAEELLISCSPDIAAVFSRSAENVYNYVTGSRSIDLKQYSSLINSSLNGRGGGSSQMLQGSVNADKEQILNFIENFKKIF